MTLTQTQARFLALSLLASVFALALSATDAEAKQKLPPETNGQARCFAENDGGDDGFSQNFGENWNRCCYEDEVAEGEYLTMCVLCDEDWKNCTEEPGNPRIRSRFQKLLQSPTVDGIWVPQPTHRTTTGGAILKRN